jgi:hypothetical protein
MTTGRLDGVSIVDYTQKLITALEALTIQTKTKDPGIVDVLNIGDESSMGEVLNRVKTQKEEGGKFLTGWKKLNEMTQNGFRRGTMVMINALQHSYKSGFTQSLFAQFALHNKPLMNDVNKKPLLLYISFEDDSEIYVEFLYRYLYYNEHKTLPDLTAVTGSEVAAYMKKRLSVNGFHVELLRVNPSEWTYKNLFNKILEYEAAGYEVHACLVDYLAKLPTTGCISSGPMGTDVRDLFNRVRNFFSAKNILFITPHQLSTEAKQLIRNGVPAISFVKEIAGKGYTEGSRQLDQVVDLEIYLHKATINRKWVLTVQRGKDRTPGILDDDKMYFVLPFPKGAPIAEDINEDNVEDINPNAESKSMEFDF